MVHTGCEPSNPKKVGIFTSRKNWSFNGSLDGCNSFGPKIVQPTCIRSEIVQPNFFFQTPNFTSYIFNKFEFFSNFKFIKKKKKFRGCPMWYIHELFWTAPCACPWHACMHTRKNFRLPVTWICMHTQKISACPWLACMHTHMPTSIIANANL